MKQKNLVKKIKVSERLLSQVYVADAQRIKQVLINLLSNALKFTFQGEISIEVSEEILSESTVQQTKISNRSDSTEFKNSTFVRFAV